MEFSSGTWCFSTSHGEACQILEYMTLWGKSTCRVWLSQSNTTAVILADELIPIQGVAGVGRDAIVYVAAASKVADALERTRPGENPTLLAPLSAEVIPLPHQLQALSRAIRGDHVRYLLADEVGLGKTIEAGLIMRELKIRGIVKRTLIVAPKGIVPQWQAEMKNRFHESFRAVQGEDIDSLEHIARTDASDPSPWELFDQVIVSLDSVKPIRHRASWSDDRVKNYNQNRFEELCAAGWDLVVVDEAHKLSGSTQGVARFKLGKALAEAAPYLLLLSATPHQGKTEEFQRLLSLLDPLIFSEESDGTPITRDRIAPFVIRTEKRNAIDDQGKPLFTERSTTLIPVRWEDQHVLQRKLYEEVSEYVRFGYNKAIKSKRQYLGFLMLLFQRLASSSTRAIKKALDKRSKLLLNAKQDFYPNNGISDENTDAEDFYDMDGEELLDAYLAADPDVLDSEIDELARLRDLAVLAESGCPDAKAEILVEHMERITSAEHNPDTKFLIFTEFCETQLMLEEFLQSRGYDVVLVNGSMSTDERISAQKRFATECNVMVSTDAGGEGINLQFCHIVINYDLPWNPMRIEQRIGRIDRIGQKANVIAFNFTFENSVEFRVRKVLEEKLAVILKEFGINKISDVLDSSSAGSLFQGAYINAILEPDKAEIAAQQALFEFKKNTAKQKAGSPLYGYSSTPNLAMVKYLQDSPFPYWIEVMTLAWIKSHGGTAQKKGCFWKIDWPDGTKYLRCTFNPKEKEIDSSCTILSVEDTRIQHLLSSIPMFAPGSAIPILSLIDLPQFVQGIWALGEIEVFPHTAAAPKLLRLPSSRRAFVPLFINNDGISFAPTALRFWDLLVSEEPQVHGYILGQDAQDLWDKTAKAMVEKATDQYEMLQSAYRQSLAQEKKRADTSFSARQKAIERIGLDEVRNYRLKYLEEEKRQWEMEFQNASLIVPQMKLVLITAIQKEGVQNG